MSPTTRSQSALLSKLIDKAIQIKNEISDMFDRYTNMIIGMDHEVEDSDNKHIRISVRKSNDWDSESEDESITEKVEDNKVDEEESSDSDYDNLPPSKRRRKLYKKEQYSLYFEKALSDRAVCKVCNESINKGCSKLGFIDGEHRVPISTHFNCFLRENSKIDFNTNKVAFAEEPNDTEKRRLTSIV